MGTYAVINSEQICLDIIEFDVLGSTPNPYEGTVLVRVGEPTPTPIPELGQVWDGEKFN